MPRFFVPCESITGDKIRIQGGDAVHITRSLRMARGENVTVCDSKAVEYKCVIEDFTDSDVILSVLSSCESKTEPLYKVTLYQALPKSDKMETIVQKAVETGVFEIIPFISERCISRPDEKGKKAKTERWNKIAQAASKQCGRAIIPKVQDVLSISQAFEFCHDSDISILLYEDERASSLKSVLKTLDKNAKISVFIGAEGGFSKDEVQLAKSNGIVTAGLGPRILRCETAPIVTLAAISYELEL